MIAIDRGGEASGVLVTPLSKVTNVFLRAIHYCTILAGGGRALFSRSLPGNSRYGSTLRGKGELIVRSK